MQLSHPDSPRLARDALVLGLSAALNGNPTLVTGVHNTPQADPQPSVSQQYLNLSAGTMFANFGIIARWLIANQ